MNLLSTIEAIAWHELAWEIHEQNRVDDAHRARLAVVEAHALATYSRDFAGRISPQFADFEEMVTYIQRVTEDDGQFCDHCGNELGIWCRIAGAPRYERCGCHGEGDDSHVPSFRESAEIAWRGVS